MKKPKIKYETIKRNKTLKESLRGDQNECKRKNKK